MNRRPRPTSGLRHIALFARNFDACVDFYTRLMGMRVEWHPDADNIYLTSGNDNLALHSAGDAVATSGQRFDHMGFIVDTPADVDDWHTFLAAAGVTITQAPRTHRDGARSFYCCDPDGTAVQIIFHPPLAPTHAPS